MTPTPAASRSWTTHWRFREAWMDWRMSWRRWQMPSVCCHNDAPPQPPFQVSDHLAVVCFLSAVLCNVQHVNKNSVFISLWCISSMMLFLMSCCLLWLAVWPTRLQPLKPQCSAQAMFPKMFSTSLQRGSVSEMMGFYWLGHSCF